MNLEGRNTVLIVEDDRICARALTRLVDTECHVRAVSTKAEALDALEYIDQLRAAVIDVRLPDGNGLDVVEEFHNRRPDLPVSIITAYYRTDIVEKIFSLDARFLAKPFNTYDLEAIRDYVLGAAPSTVGRRLRVLAKEKEFTSMETEIVGLAANGFDRKAIAEWLDLSMDELNGQVDLVLQKCEASRLGDVVGSLLREEGSE